MKGGKKMYELYALDVPKLKSFFETRNKIDKEIEEELKKVQKDLIVLHKAPNIKNISKAIRKILDRGSQDSWCDSMLRFIFKSPSKRKAGSFTKNVFIFGRRRTIFNDLHRISENIFHEKALQEHEIWVGFDYKYKPNIEDLI